MKLFIEGAATAAIEDLLDAGLCDGVVLDSATARDSKALRRLVEKLIELTVGPIIVPVEGGPHDAILARARALAQLGEEVVASVPFCRDGLVACRIAFDEGIATHLAPCFGPAQVLLAAKAGATWVGLSIADADAAGADGVKLVEEAVSLLTHHDFEAQVLASDLRHALQVGDVALAGCHAARLTPEAVWRLAHPALAQVPSEQRAPRPPAKRV